MKMLFASAPPNQMVVTNARSSTYLHGDADPSWVAPTIMLAFASMMALFGSLECLGLTAVFLNHLSTTSFAANMPPSNFLKQRECLLPERLAMALLGTRKTRQA